MSPRSSSIEEGKKGKKREKGKKEMKGKGGEKLELERREERYAFVPLIE